MPRARKTALPNPANNRTDLNTPAAPQRVLVAPDQEYGKATAQTQSQKILPIGTPGVATPPPAGGGQPTPVAAPPAQGAPGVAPGELPWKKEPGQGLPLTHGLPFGPGAGPEALSGAGEQWNAMKQTGEQGTLRSVLTHLAAQPQSSSIIRSLAAAAGQ